MNPHFANRTKYFLVIPLLLFVELVAAQSYWERTAFLSEPLGMKGVIIETGMEPMEIIQLLQPLKRNLKIQGDQVLLNYSFLVFERAMVGRRPFGKVRYQMTVVQDDDQLVLTFQDFTFSSYRKSARYGRMMEVGKTLPVIDFQEKLNEVQYGIVIWSIDDAIQRKVRLLNNSMNESRGDNISD